MATVKWVVSVGFKFQPSLLFSWWEQLNKPSHASSHVCYLTLSISSFDFCFIFNQSCLQIMILLDKCLFTLPGGFYALQKVSLHHKGIQEVCSVTLLWGLHSALFRFCQRSFEVWCWVENFNGTEKQCRCCFRAARPMWNYPWTNAWSDQRHLCLSGCSL